MANIFLILPDETKAKVMAEIERRKKSNKMAADASLSSLIRDYLDSWLKGTKP